MRAFCALATIRGCSVRNPPEGAEQGHAGRDEAIEGDDGLREGLGVDAQLDVLHVGLEVRSVEEHRRGGHPQVPHARDALLKGLVKRRG